jgi:hypothetical protein
MRGDFQRERERERESKKAEETAAAVDERKRRKGCEEVAKSNSPSVLEASILVIIIVVVAYVYIPFSLVLSRCSLISSVYARGSINNNKKSNKTQGRVEMKENYIHESNSERERKRKCPPQQTSSIISISISEYSGIDGRGFVSYVQIYFLSLSLLLVRPRIGKNKEIFSPLVLHV